MRICSFFGDGKYLDVVLGPILTSAISPYQNLTILSMISAS